ncbi:unnamed protein product (macronuclear) [Paramecium tetraurelia]|uniref:t-SNARE coiled-coil homology domain-containing protein n=1 Tax=Paramecium tetraurelia TaxID=5888 RepID=A0CN98_PARTE|nr:uncharacterized protein GSPATT00008706001 [Paramecium tetraurelia]CAK72265.1 unnamed protein product [Paramecium tetraurelia]|eukprot:XP_001439662.1 hypothetical protein (macronuclear) [Paramecium tetraurelia strain d4-2]
MNYYTTLDRGSKLQDFIEQIRKMDATISNAVYHRNLKLQKNESVQMLDKLLAMQIDGINDSIKQARVLLNKSPNLSQQDIQRSKTLLDEFQNNSEKLRKTLDIKQVFKIDAPDTQTDFTSKSNVEMVQMQKQLVSKQNETIDKMIDTTGRMQLNAQNINLALGEDKVILRRLNENVEQATHEIKDTDSNLKSLLSYTNDCCLWTSIIIEFMIFVFLVIY